MVINKGGITFGNELQFVARENLHKKPILVYATLATTTASANYTWELILVSILDSKTHDLTEI